MSNYYRSILNVQAPSFTNTKSVSFDGIDDYVDCGDADNLSFGNGSTDSPFSISAWIKIGQTTTQGIVSKFGGNTNLREWLLYTTGAKLRLLLVDASNGKQIFGTSPSNLSINNWHHVVCTYNGVGGGTAANGIKLYINGVAQSVTVNNQSSYTAMSNTNTTVKIGKFVTSEIQGSIDEVAIFNSELSSSDVTAIYNSGVPSSLASYSSHVSWLRMGDGDTFPTLIDNGSGGNNGTMQNMTSGNIVTDVPT